MEYQLKPFDRPLSTKVESASKVKPKPKANAELFVPAKSIESRPDGSPIALAEVVTRKDVLEDWLSDEKASAGGVYKFFFWGVVLLVATAVTLFYNIYLAGVFAFLCGYAWSERVIGQAWSRQWYETKTFIYTA